jgi:hypothetical protein
VSGTACGRAPPALAEGRKGGARQAVEARQNSSRSTREQETEQAAGATTSSSCSSGCTCDSRTCTPSHSLSWCALYRSVTPPPLVRKASGYSGRWPSGEYSRASALRICSQAVRKFQGHGWYQRQRHAIVRVGCNRCAHGLTAGPGAAFRGPEPAPRRCQRLCREQQGMVELHRRRPV